MLMAKIPLKITKAKINQQQTFNPDYPIHFNKSIKNLSVQMYKNLHTKGNISKRDSLYRIK